MTEFHLLTNLTVALAAAFIGGILARRVNMPTIVGYLLAGIAIGPFTPGFVGDVHAISELAEIGIIFLMFGVGLHFSLRDLWVVRDIALPGALVQMTIATALGVGLTQLWGWSLSASLILGLSISIASTVVLLRGLEDQGMLNTVHGRVAVGWLVVEDIATVVILVVLRAVGGQGSLLETGALTLAKAGVFVALMLFVGARFVPWLFARMAFIGSRELFILTVLVVALGTAFAAYEFFGVSLALGAFLAGITVSESTTSYQVGADILPFREIFSILFFVSVGMLVNPLYLVMNAGQVLAVSGLIVIAKPLIAALVGFVLPYPARTALVVGAGLSQIGEFSFLLGSAAVGLNLLGSDQYSLILAGAVLSIVVNPLMFRAVNPIEAWLKRNPGLWKRLNHHGPEAPPAQEQFKNHVVVVGYGRVGHHVVDVLEYLKIPRLVVDAEATRIAAVERLGVPTLFGDAANSEVLKHAGLEHARALVVTVPDEATAEVVVAAAQKIAPKLPIIARAGTQKGVTRLSELGAQDVIHPELEGGLEIVRHTLLRLGLPPLQVQKYTDIVRHDHYDVAVSIPEEYRLLEQLTYALRGMEIVWHQIGANNPFVGKTIANVGIRDQTGASVIAVIRQDSVIANPKSAFQLQADDLLGVLGTESQVRAAQAFLEHLEPAPGSRTPALSPENPT